MKLKRLVGFLFLAAAGAGFIFSVIGLFEIWHYRPVVTKSMLDALALFDQTLITTQDGLTIVGKVVQTTLVDVASLEATTHSLARTIHDTNPMLETLTNLTRKDFPAALNATQTSLTSAQNSALLIDNVLTTLTTIPLLSVASYQPAVPLHTALAQVSTSLNSLTPALDTITSSLVDGKTNLSVVEDELNKISDNTKSIGDKLNGVQNIIDQYKKATLQLQIRVEAIQRGTPGIIMTMTWIVSSVLGWVLITQLGLFAQGLDMLRDRREAIWPLAKNIR